MNYDRIYKYKFKDSTLFEYQMVDICERDIFVVTDDYFRFYAMEEERKFQPCKAIVLDEDRRHYLVEMTVNEIEDLKTYMEVAEIDGDLQVLPKRYIVQAGEDKFYFDNFYDACIKKSNLNGAQLLVNTGYVTSDEKVIEDILKIYEEIMLEK